MKKTRKNLSRRKRTYRRKRGSGGPCRNPEDRDLVYIWRYVSDKLKAEDSDYAWDWAQNVNWGSCNMYVWKVGFGGLLGAHLDIYWRHDYGRHVLYGRASNTLPGRGKFVVDTDQEDLTDRWNALMDSDHKEDLSADIAPFIDNLHRRAFRR